MGVLYNAQHLMRKHRLPGVPARGSFGTAARFAQMLYLENDRDCQLTETTRAASQL
jgi:hypothetical protein